MDSTASGSPRDLTTTGTYGVAASGMASISSPLISGEFIYGLVANGVFVGSSTEGLSNDLFLASANPTAPLTNKVLNGAYQLVTMDYPGTDATLSRSSTFQLIADGNGGFGAGVNVAGVIAGQVATPVREVHTAVTYAFQEGGGIVSFGSPAVPPPGPQTPLISGDKTLFTSQDGNLIFGGSSTGWDMFIGVRTGTGLTPPSFTGLHFQAGLDEDVSQLATGTITLDSYYGSVNTGDGMLVGHQRMNTLVKSNPYDYSYGDSYVLKTDGTYDDIGESAHYIAGAGGIRVGLDTGTYLGISVAIPAPALTGSGVFINPQGIVNAASFAPFTAGLSPGEFITIYGSGLAAGTQAATSLPLPGSLGGVQVLINGIAAPLAVVSPGAISALVPYGITDNVAAVQVFNGGTASNVVTMYTTKTAAGVFTFPADGLGSSAALHLDYTLVTSGNPANTGETLALYVAGLGAVSPSVADGAAASATSLSNAANLVNVEIDGKPATVTYAGLAPSLAGLYQLNVVVPQGIHSGNVYVNISGPDSYTSEAVLPIAAGMGTVTGNAVPRAARRPAATPSFLAR